MKIALHLGVILAVTVALPSLGQETRRISTCFEEALAGLRLSQLEEGITHCDEVIDDKAIASDQRGQAFAQRGLMYARQWSILSTSDSTLAVRGIADITRAFRLHTPPSARKHQLLIVRGQLYAATGQTRRASEDFTVVVREDPSNRGALIGLKQLGSPAEF